MKKTKVMSFLLSLLAAAAHGQMTLNDCLLYAREHFHNNIIARLEVEKASADKGIAASALMPYIELSSNGNLSSGRSIDPETNTYDNKRTIYTGFGLGFSLPVFDGFASINSYKAARIAKLRLRSKAQADEDLASLEVIKNFYNVIYCKALILQMDEQLTRDSGILAATVRGEELGTKSGADVAEIEAIVSSDKYMLTRQRNALRKAWLDLRASMGMPLDDNPELDIYETASDTDFCAAVTSVNPRIAEAEYAVDESRMRLRSARGAYSPKLSLNAGISTSYYRMIGDRAEAPSFSSQWHDNMGQYVGFSFSLPLFTGMSTTNGLKKAKLSYKVTKTERDRTVYEIEQTAAVAELDYESASEEFTAACARVDAEEIAFRAISRKYELGSASAIDLYTAGAKLATARAEKEGKRIQKITSRIVLGYYRGEKLIREQQWTEK